MANLSKFTSILGHLDITAVDLEPWEKRLPPGLRLHAPAWVGMYLLWLHRETYRRRFGNRQAQRAAEIAEFTSGGTTENAEAWIRLLDDAAPSAIEMRRHSRIPRELFAAYAFLLQDPESPYFHVIDIPEPVAFAFAEILGDIREAAAPAIEDFVKSLGPRRH